MVDLNEWSVWSYGWDRKNVGYNVNTNFTLLNYWGGFMGINRQEGGLATGALRGGPAMKVDGSINGWAGFFSDERKALRGSMTFTPTLTLQLYAEPFYSAGRYTEFKRAAATRAARYPDRFDVFTGARVSRDADRNVLIDIDGNDTTDVMLDNPDFSYVSFRSNVVLRWEYRPGSTLFLVWQQNRSGTTTDGRYRLGDATRNLLDTRPENVFVVKVNYWLSL